MKDEYDGLIDPDKGFVLLTVESEKNLSLATNLDDEDLIMIVLEEAMNTLKLQQESAAWETHDAIKKASKGLH